MKENPVKAVKAARGTYESHVEYCRLCEPLTGQMCPRGQQLWRRVALLLTGVIRRPGGAK